jgi:hypothetical protein
VLTVVRVARRAGESGQTTPEYVGLIVLISLLAASFGAVNPGPVVAGAITEALCRAAGAACSPAGGGLVGPPLPLVDPALTTAERTLLLNPDPQYADLELEPFSASELAWLELNDPEAFRAALELRSWSEQRDLLDQAIEAEMAAFQAIKGSEEAQDPRMDYSDDGCSAPVTGSRGASYDFTEACERHDFGYRNAKRLGLFDGYKRRIDAVFARDMYSSCEDRFVLYRKHCRFMAAIYYAGVRGAGGHCDLPGPVGRVPGPCAPEHG